MRYRRVRGHKLDWMAVTRAVCECGVDHSLDPEEMDEVWSDAEARDAILDKHLKHLREERRGRRLS